MSKPNKSNLNSIFEKWLNSADNNQLRKRYKEWITKSTTPGLTAEETVKSIDHFLIGKFQVQEKPADLQSREPKHIVPMNDISSKGPFFEFDRHVEFEKWQGKPFVKFYKSLKPKNCTECSGKGYNKCNCENGLIQCKKCNGNTTIKCNNCNGLGENAEKVEVIDGITDKKKNAEFMYQCPSCFGDSAVTCNNCSGLGKVGHQNCSFSGKLICKSCSGTGQLIDIFEEPVPIKSSLIEIFLTGTKNEHEAIVEALKQQKFNLTKLDIFNHEADLKDLSQLVVDYNKDHEKFLKILNQQIKKSITPNVDIVEPITLFTGIKLVCKSTKGHSFELWSIGDTTNFEVVPVNFAS